MPFCPLPRLCVLLLVCLVGLKVLLGLGLGLVLFVVLWVGGLGCRDSYGLVDVAVSGYFDIAGSSHDRPIHSQHEEESTSNNIANK